MAGEASEGHFLQSGFMGSVLEAELTTAPSEPDTDEQHIERGYDRIADGETSILAQAYPNVDVDPRVKEDLAWDIRRAADVRTVVEIAEDPEVGKMLMGRLLASVSSKAPTGEITLPGNVEATPDEIGGVIVGALLEATQELAVPAAESSLLDENARLREDKKKLLGLVTPETVQSQQTIESLSARVAELEAELVRKQQDYDSEHQKVADRDVKIARLESENAGQVERKLRGFGGQVLRRLRIA